MPSTHDHGIEKLHSKLPIIETTVSAYRLPFEGWRYAIKISWFWLILFLLWNFMPKLLVSQLDLTSDLHFDLLYSLSTIFLHALGWSSIFVLWHRHLLLNEHRQGLPIDISYRTFLYLWRFIMIFWHLFLNYIIIGLMLLIISILFFSSIEWDALPAETADQEEDTVTSAVLWTGAILVLVAMFLGRCGIALPAAAIDYKDFGLKAAWKATAGSSLRLSLILLLATLPASWALDFLSEVLTHFGSPLENSIGFLDEFIYQVGYTFIIFVGVSTLSISFAFLVEGRKSINLTLLGRDL